MMQIDGRIVRVLREARGWDLTTLARRAQLHPHTVSYLETRSQHKQAAQRIHVTTAQRLAAAFGVGVDALVSQQMLAQALPLAADLETLLRTYRGLTEADQRLLMTLAQRLSGGDTPCT